MKYTSEQINQMSWEEWCKTMAKELNDAGFKARGFGGEYVLYGTYGIHPDTFILGEVGRTKEIEYLKSIGLLNNDRCPLCGSSIHGNPGRFTDGYNPSLHFQICQNCVSNGRRMSDNPANKGCMIAILLLPLSLLKLLFA